MNVLSKINAKNRNVFSDLNYTWRGIRLVFNVMPKYIPCMLIFVVFSTIPHYTNIFFSAKIVDEIISNCRVKNLVFYLLLMVSINFISTLISKLGWRYVRVNQIVSGDWEEFYLNQKSFQMDFELIENKEVRELRQQIEDNRSIGGLNVLIIRLMYLIRNILNLLISCVMMLEISFMFSNKSYDGLLAFANSKWSVVVLILITVILSCVLADSAKKGCYTKTIKAKELSLVQKKSHYYINDYLEDSKTGKDVRIFNQGDIITETAQEMLEDFFALNKDLIKIQFDIDKKISFLSLFLNACVYIIISLKTLAGAFSIGVMVKYISLMNQFLFNILNLSDSIVKLQENNRYLEKLYEYLDIETKMQNGVKTIEKNFAKGEHILEFHNVSFKYPKSENYVLKNLSFKILSGDRVAIVGMNGCGKTTLIKLLCRLYDPCEGKITIDGQDIREYNYNNYLSLFSVVFQDFKLFPLSIAQNISADVVFDREKVLKCGEKVGILEFIDKLPNGLDTTVYKSFEESGVEISGGEAQKIAIARALYKDGAFVILDEPTSSLDPIAESEIFENFNHITRGKTAVFISHRLSSCKFCNKILVLDKGIIVQSGGHSDLLADKEGLYYNLWNSQAQYYKN